MTDAIGIRELLWEWALVYCERPGDAVNYPRKAPFTTMVHERQEGAPDKKRADNTDMVVRDWLQVMLEHRGSAAVREELDVFWLRYHSFWELQDVARRLRLSMTKVRDHCKRIEAEITILYRKRAMAA
ncbi:hypothetical protein [uncultured Microbulbifer sp.]|uniref:hypothetical protein n=1 Tax=uncultured Microbulbifer sp. TaxID=348147 RepID=UPI00262F342A|nr:hypothetical protein [uncultured Microbulbifer sp.]